MFHRKPGGPRSGKYNRKLNLEIHGLEKAESRPRLVTKLPGKLGIWQTARSLSASAEGVVDGARQCQDTRRGRRGGLDRRDDLGGSWQVDCLTHARSPWLPREEELALCPADGVTSLIETSHLGSVFLVVAPGQNAPPLEPRGSSSRSSMSLTACPLLLPYRDRVGPGRGLRLPGLEP